ncbi:hypothetical protein JW835_10985 [bacterium]|nr:hypothetical protein [bacterium]
MNSQEIQNDEFGYFAYIISHDLKAPLRAIQILTKWITQENGDRLTESGQEHLMLILDRVKRMDDIIDSISLYSRIGRENIEPKSVDLNQLVDYVITVMKIPKHITCTKMKNMPVINCQKTHVEQIFRHLIGNAVQYMDKSEGKIEIDFSKENKFWRFSVSDNGPGIPEKYHKQIFQIFQTLHSKDDTNSKGIGLTLSKRMIELAGGHLWLESKENKGSTFFFTLPRNKEKG